MVAACSAGFANQPETDPLKLVVRVSKMVACSAYFALQLSTPTLYKRVVCGFILSPAQVGRRNTQSVFFVCHKTNFFYNLVLPSSYTFCFISPFLGGLPCTEVSGAKDAREAALLRRWL